MTDWNLPLSYQPKIEPVKNGQCTQTIRVCGISKSKKHPGKIIQKEVGDRVRFRVWTGKAYRSPSVAITGYLKLTSARSIRIMREGIIFEDNLIVTWDNPRIDFLAALDGIIPPTGEALRDVLMAKNKIPEAGVEGQILRWG